MTFAPITAAAFSDFYNLCDIIKVEEDEDKMWIMTSFGIFMPSLRPAEHVPKGDERLLQIRARRHRELVILRREYMPDAGEIIHLKNTDYEYRIYCTHDDWALAMARMAHDIDYVKFKDTTKRYHDDQLHNAYIRIWSLLYGMFSTNKVFTPKKQKTKTKTRGRYDEQHLRAPVRAAPSRTGGPKGRV